MSQIEESVIARMQALNHEWEAASDQRAVFLTCYLMMSRNMLSALDEQVFRDPAWVDRLLERFADYYFDALEAYERDAAAAPAVWQLAHNSTRDDKTVPVQQLLLGVNAHINYDLVLALTDLLSPEWDSLSESQRADRHTDHSMVNEVIGRTIDAVQDQILEPGDLLMEIIDGLLGPFDEMIISGLIGQWREKTWQQAVKLLGTHESTEKTRLVGQIEEDALELGRLISLAGPRSTLPDFL